MWIFTTGGFLSAVVDRDDESGQTLLVRARDRVSIEGLADGVELVAGEPRPVVVTGEGTDYPYRARVSRAAFVAFMAQEIEQYLTYTNFKDAAKVSLGDEWGKALMDIWIDAHRFTDDEGHDLYRQMDEWIDEAYGPSEAL